VRSQLLPVPERGWKPTPPIAPTTGQFTLVDLLGGAFFDVVEGAQGCVIKLNRLVETAVNQADGTSILACWRNSRPVM
jgi:hypothetical protein